MANQSPGFESLLEALKQSGVDMGGFGGSGSRGGSGSGASSDDASASSDDDPRTGGARPFNPFNPFGGGRGGAGGGGKRPPSSRPEMGFLDNLSSWGKKAIIIAIIVIVIVALIAYWWFHPPINIHSSDTWVFVTIFILLPLFLVFRSKSRKYSASGSTSVKNEGKAKTFKILSFVPVVIVLVGVVGALASLSIFPGNAERYANVLKVEDSTFAEDIQEVNYSEIPIIDQDSAARLGNTQLGSIPEYVSQFTVSNLYSQINYHQEPVRVSPLGYADLFKWLTNRENGIPAYALVNMTTQDAEIVSLPEGEGIKYSESEPLARNIDRYVQLKYPFYMFDQKSFEIDEDGHPWWICPVQTRTIGLFGGTTISRVVLVDAVTGECQDLAIEDCPQWVDRAYPSDLLIEQYNWHGAYSSGWLNSWLGQQGVVQTTPGTDGQLGYNYIAKDDDVWVYTGVTSATSDTSIVGFVLINQRTAEAHFYSVSGATEDRAMQSAEGAVQDLGYSSTFPILINVSGNPTYFMSLKDGAGTVKQFAMVDVRSFNNVAVGSTVQEAQNNYLQVLSAAGVELNTSTEVGVVGEASGVISRMASVVIEGNSHFYVMLEGDGNLYDFALPSLVDIVMYREGDTISFTYLDGDSQPIVVDAIQ